MACSYSPDIGGIDLSLPFYLLESSELTAPPTTAWTRLSKILPVRTSMIRWTRTLTLFTLISQESGV